MRTNIQFLDMPVSDSLTDRIKTNLDKLSGKYPWLIGAEVILKKDNDPTGVNNWCEIQLSAPGPNLFAKSRQDNFEKAARVAVDELSIQLEKRKKQFRHY